MKPKEHKEYFPDQALSNYCFFVGKTQHGECKYFHRRNGNLWISTCFLDGDEHGQYAQYEENGDLFGYNFKYKGKLVLGFPFLPKTKPARKRYKSLRTRYQTLEI